MEKARSVLSPTVGRPANAHLASMAIHSQVAHVSPISVPPHNPARPLKCASAVGVSTDARESFVESERIAMPIPESVSVNRRLLATLIYFVCHPRSILNAIRNVAAMLTVNTDSEVISAFVMREPQEIHTKDVARRRRPNANRTLVELALNAAKDSITSIVYVPQASTETHTSSATILTSAPA